MLQQHFYLRKITGTLTAFIFLWQTAAAAAPLPGIEIISTPAPEARLPSGLWAIEIPESLGTIQARYEGASASGVVLIQDAHAHFEAQKKIQGLLEHLHSSYGMNLLLLEGGFNKLDPDWYRYFEDDQLNLELAETLAAKGVTDGPELFLLHSSVKPENDVEAFGVEEPILYEQNLKTFREVRLQKSIADEFLTSLKGGILTRSSGQFNKKLYELFRAWLFFEDTGTEWMRHLNILSQYAKSELAIDLTHSRAQMEWPYLTRFFRLSEMEAKQDLEAAAKEKETVLAQLAENNLPDHFSSALKAWKPGHPFKDKHFASLRDFTEKLLDEGQDSSIALPNYPSLMKAFGWSILREEIQAPELMAETEKLLDRILEALIQNSEERRLIEDYKNYLLLKKLLALELTNEEYADAAKRLNEIRPSKILPAFEGTGRAERLFFQAILFYRQAVGREEAILQNVLGHMSFKGAPAILVAGGFHAKGLQALFEQYEVSYITVTPRISEIQKNENYLRIMTLQGDELARRSYVDLPQPADVSLPSMLPEYDAMYGEYKRIAAEAIIRNHPGALKRENVPITRSELRFFRYFIGPALALLLFNGDPAASYGQYREYSRSGYQSKPVPPPELPRMLEMSLDLANRDVLVSQLGPENGYRRVERPVTMEMRLNSLQSVRKYLNEEKYYLPRGEQTLFNGLEAAASKSSARLRGQISNKVISAQVEIINKRQKAGADVADDFEAQEAYKTLVAEYKSAVRTEIAIQEELITILNGLLTNGDRFKSEFILKQEARQLAELVSGKDFLKQYDETIRIHRLLRLDPKEVFRAEVKELGDNFYKKHGPLLPPIEKTVQARLDAMLKQKKAIDDAIDPNIKGSKGDVFKQTETALTAAASQLQAAYVNRRGVQALLADARKELSTAEKELNKNNTAENRDKVRTAESNLAAREKDLRDAERAIEIASEDRAKHQKAVDKLKLEIAETRGSGTELERNMRYLREALAALQKAAGKEPDKRSELRIRPEQENLRVINTLPAILDAAGFSGNILPETLRQKDESLFRDLVEVVAPALIEKKKLNANQQAVLREQLEARLASLKQLDALELLSFDGAGSAIVSAAQLSALNEELLLASFSVLAGVLTDGQRLIVGKDDTQAADALKRSVLGAKNGLSETVRNRLSRGLIFPDPYLSFDELIAREVQMSRKRAEGIAAAFDAEVLQTLPPEFQQLMIRMVTNLEKDFESTDSGEELARQAEALAVLFLMIMDLGAKLRDVPPDQLAVKIREYFEAKNMSRIIFNKDGSFNQPSWQDISAYLTRLRAAAESMAKSA